jgi:2-polyprenyl-6-methoxyphenol hydroxylase-like FAD-dependent oxidoreductase
VSRQWDAIVVGARVAGAATAMQLARGGLRVLCLDRSPYGRDTLSTHALMRGGVLQLQRWGLVDELVAAGTPAVRRTMFHYGEESVAVSIKPAVGVDALLAPRRTVLDPVLVRAAERAGAVVRFGAPVIRLHRDHCGAVAGVVVGNRRSDVTSIESAPLVIGADGRHSIVARQVGARRTARGYHAASFLYGYHDNLPTNGYEWFYRPGLTAGAIPTNGGLTCVFVGARASRLDPAVRANTAADVFDHLVGVSGLGSRLGSGKWVESVKYVRGLPAGYLRQAHGSGWALVGDAGHWLDPMSTHGMTAALRDATLLARAILSSSARAGERERALADYQAVRDRLSLPMMRITEEIASYTWDLHRARILLRELSSAMADEVEALAAIEPDP